MEKSRQFIAVAAFGLLATSVFAVQPVPLFTDHAVLQSGKPVAIWGKGAPGEKVTVRFKEASAQATTGTDGNWSVELPALKSGDSGDLVFEGANTVTSKDILVGDVWLCAGQSNMEWLLSRSKDGDKEVAAADFPQIRHFKVKHFSLEKPTKQLEGQWMVCTPQNAGNFTAVGYFFATYIQAKLKQPIGLLDVSWGASPIETWLSDEALNSKPELAVIRERWSKYLTDEYPGMLKAFQDATAEQKKNPPAPGATPPKIPRKPDSPGTQKVPSGGFNGVMNPVIPYTLKGILWYQGEHNTMTYPGEYASLLETLIADLRAKWHDPELPFIFEQLANYHGSNSMPTNWAVVREQQEKVLEIPHTGMGVGIDIWLPNETVHPLNKREIGRRLSLVGLDKVYGVPTLSTGPVFKGQTIEGNKVRLKFDTAGSKLVLKAPTVPGPSFEVAGKDQKLHPAEAILDGPDIIVQSKDVAEPLTVRYLWVNAPAAILYNEAGLPAPPFRTDTWQEPPPGKKGAKPAAAEEN